ncbi:hypothetical protein [Burkholderia ubonensis]|uniref:hypothetical protein n=1 Tax=Burkholderia ubonensis TaxID=101571 RepID=UPI0011604204|nr:hypothetical protein [Burkholderia ubonensis]
MLDITGTYGLHGGISNFIGLDIGSVDVDSGALQDSVVRDGDFNTVPIMGRFDAATNSVAFSVEQFPGDTFFTTTFTGLVVPDSNSLGGVVGLAGSWNQLTIEVGAPIEGKLPVPKLVSETGGWFADQHEKI